MKTGTSVKRLAQEQFKAELSALPSWSERARAIERKLAENARALASRNEKLLGLRSDFDQLTLDFWQAFARSLGCENPALTIEPYRTNGEAIAKACQVMDTCQTIYIVDENDDVICNSVKLREEWAKRRTKVKERP